MTGLTVIDGGGDRTRVQPCTFCGIPHTDRCQLLARHLRHLELLGRSPITVDHRKRTAERLGAALVRMAGPVPERTVPCGGPSPRPACVTDATAGDLYAWRSSLRVADATAAAYLSHVKEIFRWLAVTGYRPDDPSAALPVPVTPRRLPRPIAEEDLMRALECAPARIRLMIVLGAWCGLRCKEIALLRREHIRDTSSEPVLVVVIGAAKGKKERSIPLSPWVVEQIQAARLPRSGYIFRRYDAAQPEFYGNQHVLGSRAGRAGPLAPWMVSRLIGEHLHDCGISATAHQLRHRCLSKAYEVSRDVLAVQELAGHAAVSSTQGYVKLSGNRTREIVAALPVPELRIVRDDETG